MSTLSPRLQLKRPDGGDPFRRSDYVDSLNKIDGSPGPHICTSTSRPNWGTAQNGRTILETNTRAEFMWNGTTWLPLLTATSAWALGATPNTFQGTNTIVTHSLGTITTTRAGTLVVDIAASMSCIDTVSAYVSAQVYINGLLASGNGQQGYIQWTGSNNNGATTDCRTIVAKGNRAVVAGTHTIALRTSTGTGANSIGTLRIGASILLANETSR